MGGQRVELSDIESHIEMTRSALLLPKVGPLANHLTAVLEVSLPEDHDLSSFIPLDQETVAGVRLSLAKRVPSYMIPSMWLGIAKLPASTSNKLDRKSLLGRVEALSRENLPRLRWDNASSEIKSPELDAQQTLLRDACSQALNLPFEQIAMGQSFLALGGDSITAMQVSSIIRRGGSKILAVRHLLTCPSLLHVAAQMENLQITQIKEQPRAQALKQFPLSPMQQFFVETALPSFAWHHYNQNVLLRLTEHREPGEIERAISGLLSRHPMLRVRFKVLPSGSWAQYIVPEEDAQFRLEYYTDIPLQEEQRRIMMNARKSLNLFDGPVLRAQLFEGSGSAQTSLFIVAHHIVVDLVSWRVIVEELESSLTKLQGGSITNQTLNELFVSSQQSLPFLYWAQLQWQASQKLQPSQTLPALPRVPDSDISFWGILPSENVYLDVKEHRMTLNPSTTRNLLFDCHQALRTEPVDVLIASVLISLKRAFPERQPPPIFNEGHGREPWDDGLDISRTVGWFTTVTPIYAAVDADDVVDVVRRVKDFRKATPSKGFDYFSSKYLTKQGKAAFKDHLPAEILFNYEGRYQSLEKEHALLKPDSWEAGEELADMGPQLQRFCLFELSAAILADGQLHFTSAYNSRARYQDRIVIWLETLLPEVIKETIASLMETRPQFTLSDVGRRDIVDYSEVEALTDLVVRNPKIQSIEDIESINYGSPMQNSLALSQSKANSDAYEIDFTWEVSANDDVRIYTPINPERLKLAWRETILVHPTLRTVFFEASTAMGTEMLHQTVLRHYDPCCISLQAKDRRDALDILADFPACREQGLFQDTRPPHRLIICSTTDGQCFIRLQINHIVLDGMSITPLLSSLGKAYRDLELNEQRVPTRQAPFADFIRYIREPERRMKSITYWKSHLSNAKPCIFPTLTDSSMTISSEDKPRRGSVSIPLSVNLLQLQQIASKLQVTLPTIVHLAWALVLRLYTGERSVLFGYLSSGRDAPIDGIEEAVGPFLAMLVCSIDFNQGQTTSMSDMLQQIQLSFAQSISHQACSLAEIQSALNLPGNPLLFNSGITFATKLSKQAQISRKSPLIFDTILEKDPTEFDMSLFVDIDDHERTISMHLDYLESAISGSHAKNVASSMDYMLTELTHNPNRHADELCVVTKHDMKTIWDWNGPLISPLNKCAHDIFAERVFSYPNREAIFSWDGIMTYQELDAISTRLGKHLVELGVGPEKMIPVCFEKSMWAVVAILAIIKAGGCFVLLDPAHPTSRLWSLIEELDASVLVCSPLTSESKRFEEIIKEEKRPISTVKVDSAYVEGLPTYSVLPGTAISDVQPENLVYAVFTSGTTGKPKGTLITHRALSTGLKEHADATGMGMMGPDTRSLQFASFSFDAAIGDVFTTIEVGGCLCIPSEEQRSPADITAFIAKSKANWTGITPSFASLLDPAAVPTLRAVCLAGEPLPASQVDAWVDRVSLINMYGPTECTIACVANSEVTRQTGASNIGRGYRATTWIVDENDHHRLRPIGTIGELLIEGPVLARGYLNRPEKTAEVFIDSPHWLQSKRPNSKLYKTGDLVRYNSDGTINFIGRKDTQIKINGQRVEVGEIESVLSSNIERSEATIIVELLKRAETGESDLLVAFICISSKTEDLEERQTVRSEEIISTSESSLSKFRSLVAKILHPQSSVSTLPRYMIPQAYIPLERVPLSVSGKTDRRALQNASAQLGRAELVAFTSGITSTIEDNLETDAQVLLARLWQKVLKIDVQGKQSNFIHLGGDSLNAMALRAEVLRAGFKLSVADIFANPDLADMAEVLVSSPPSTESSSPLDSSAPSTPPSQLPEVKPFSLLSTIGLDPSDELLKEISRECSVLPEQLDDVFPCTPMQEGLMALSSSKAREGAYALHAAFKLPAEIDVAEFLRAWEITMMEYPICRSRIVPRPEGSLVVVTRATPDVYLESGEDLKEHLAQQRRTTFSYGAPLFRLGIFHDKGQNSKYLVMNAHHAVYDGWSIKLIWESALASYAKKEIFTEQGPTFQTFVRELNLQDHEASKTYWENSLIEEDQDGFKFPVAPGSHSAIASSSKVFSLKYDSESTRSLGITTSELLNATWAITLSQYSASSSVTFGVTLSGRDIPLPGADQIVGPTITTVPRQISIRKDESIPDFLRHVRRTAAEALPHQHLGLQRISGLSPTARKACDFTSLLIVTPGSLISPSSMEHIGIVLIPIEAADFHPYPLALECRPENGALEIEVAFDPECIDPLTVERMMQQFDHVLQCINQSSTTETIGSLFTEVSPSHLETMINWNSKAEDTLRLSRPDFVHQLVVDRAKTQPSSPAIETRDETFTYEQLDQLSETLYSQISEAKGKGLVSPFVGLYMDKSPTALVSMLAILKSGLAFMPLSPSQPIARIRTLLEAAGAKFVLTSPDRLQPLSDSLPGCHVLPVNLKTLTQAPPSTNSSAAVRDSSSPAYLLYTSGTTGKPKGVVINHGAWLNAIVSQARFFSLNQQTRMLQFSSFTFDVSLFEIFCTLASGGCVCIPSETERMNDLAGFIQSMNINSLSLTPTVARLLNAQEMSNIDLVVFAGEALTQADIDSWARPGRRMVNAYGPTEACIYATARNISEDQVAKKATNIGRPLGTDVWVVNPLTDTLCPIGGVGELCIGGGQLAQEYYGDVETTKKAFTDAILAKVPNWEHSRRLYRTGDLVRLESDGTVDFLGRRDAQVKLRGQRISLAEIEYHVQKCMKTNAKFRHATVQLHKQENGAASGIAIEPSLVTFLVIDVPFENQVGDVGYTYMSTSKDAEISGMATDLRKKLRSVLPDYMVPSIFIALERLPTNASGKLDRQFIEQCLQGFSPVPHSREAIKSAPLTPPQAIMQGWWARVLGVEAESISAGSDFFALGGNSLSGIKLVSLARSCGQTLSYENVLLNPVLSDMAGCVGTANAESGAARRSAQMMKPFGLLSNDDAKAVFQDTLPLYGIKPQDVEDVYPTIPFQEAAIALAARDRNIYIMIIAMKVPVADLERLKASWASAFAEFAVLRTRIVPSTRHDEAYQVVVKNRSLVWKEMPSVDAFVEHVYDSQDFGQPLARIALVKPEPSTNPDASDTITVLFGASHALYDGYSLSMLWPILFPTSPPLAGAVELPKSTPFREFVAYQMRLDTAKANNFWRTKLAGLSSTPFPSPASPIQKDHVTALRKAEHRKFVVPAQGSGSFGATPAVIAQAAWALTVSHFTANRDTLFRIILTGRDVASEDVPGIETVAGPTATIVPCRTIIDYEATVALFLSGLRRDNLDVARFAHIGLERVSRLSKDCRRACEMISNFNFNFHAVSEEPGGDDASGGEGVYRPKMIVGDDGFSSNCLMAELTPLVGSSDFLVAMNYDPAYVSAAQAPEIMNTFIGILERLFAADATTTLREISTMLESPWMQPPCQQAAADSASSHHRISPDEAAAPLSHTEALVANAWRKVLAIDASAASDRSADFFALGGNSLLGLRVGAELRRAGFSLRVPQIFQNPTLMEMASALQPSGGAAS